MLTVIIPTRDRPEHLALTFAALGRLDPGAITHALGGAEVIVVDNASRFTPRIPERLANGLGVRMIQAGENEGAAARNRAARAARDDPSDANHWLLMLDDDSAPIDAGFASVLASAPPDVAAVGAEIMLSDGAREIGGLPEVFIGCGAAVRRRMFLDAGGYDPSFGYYAEEYDLCARLILARWRIVHDRRFRVLHRKSAEGRDMNLILGRLVRNNTWVEQRYCPGELRDRALVRTLDRYRTIAERENAVEGYERGAAELVDSLSVQPRREMPPDLYDRFTGTAACRDWLPRALEKMRANRIAVVDVGKNEWAIRGVLAGTGVREVDLRDAPEALVIGTLSPGPMLDALERRSRATGGPPVLAPWEIGPAVGSIASAAA